MKRILPLLFVLFCSNEVFAQQATFTAGWWKEEGEPDRHTLEDLKTMLWRINGKVLLYGDTVKITPDEKVFDTVLFKRNSKSDWDTIICNIAKAHLYRFVYNACCGGFDIYNVTLNEKPKGSALFKLYGKGSGDYLGFWGETGILANKNPDELPVTSLCRSAMSPNIYWVQLQEIEVCKDSTGCANPESDLECYLIEGKETYEFYYREKKAITRFLYMPLDDEKPLTVIYNVNKHTVLLR
ncbi:MAG: hypothetical protein ACO1PI_03525 [Bacteroidota bacterium]